jgi:hypothetical protein
MTFRKFFILTFFQWLLFLGLKLLYLKWEVFGNTLTSDVVYFALVAIVAAAVARRFGVINYLEAMFVMIFWFITDALLYLLTTAFILGLGMFLKWQLWAGYFIIMFVVLTFHKKRHVHIRHEQRQHH